MTDKILIDRAVVEQALDALQDAETVVEHRQDIELRRSAMVALRAALEQPVEQEQEPAAYLFQHEETGLTQLVDVQQVEWGFEKNNPRWQKISPVYTHPQHRQPLTDEAIAAIIKSNFVEITNQNLYDAIYLCMRDVESAHDIEAARGIGDEK